MQKISTPNSLLKQRVYGVLFSKDGCNFNNGEKQPPKRIIRAQEPDRPQAYRSYPSHNVHTTQLCFYQR